MDAVHTAFTKCTRILQSLPPEEQRKVVEAFAVLLGLRPYDSPQGGEK